jgi:hypothetical protein
MWISGNNKHRYDKAGSASKHHAVKRNNRVMVAQLHEFVTSGTDKGKVSVSLSVRVTPDIQENV